MKKRDKLDHYEVITIDESFSVSRVISKLRKLYCSDVVPKKVGIFFKFTLFNIQVSKKLYRCYGLHNYGKHTIATIELFGPKHIAGGSMELRYSLPSALNSDLCI